MAQNSISYQEVAEAAERLRADGRAVGPTKVREVLGRGSFSTVQKYLTEWEAKQAELRAREDETRRAGPPEELGAELSKIMAEYWPHAVARAKEELRPEAEALEAKVSEANARAKEALVELGNLENKLEAALVKAARMEDAEKRAAEANERIIQMQSELSRLEKIETRFDDQRELVQALQEQVRSLGAQNAELSEVRRKLETAQVAAARGEARISALQEQNAELTKQTEVLRTEAKEAATKLARLEVRLENAARQVEPAGSRAR